MALYIPESRRRRRLIVVAAIAVVVGLAVGVLIGRATVPTVSDRIATVRTEARDISGGLRVLVLHIQAHTANDTAGEAKTVVAKVRSQLLAEFDKAPWLGDAQKRALLTELASLTDRTDPTSAAFGSAAESLARHIDVTFGA
ncbi:MAG: hypothetical protein QOH89_2338 [Pseudonocardiales bacterium]|nr:hypothetical protein [Pseudonocardiales bacterium]